MKPTDILKSVITVTLITLFGVLSLIGCEKSEKDTHRTFSDAELKLASLPESSFCQQIDSLPFQELNEDEKAGLVFMREEEKLARDVYIFFSEIYETPVFKNISKSEQIHTNAVKSLINKYNLSDPVTDDSLGVFVNHELNTLYSELTKSGTEDIINALKAGALIEETDIIDLVEQIDKSDNEDIKFVYSNLKRASGYHLKAFVFNLKIRGIVYEPVLLDKTHYLDLVTK